MTKPTRQPATLDALQHFYARLLSGLQFGNGAQPHPEQLLTIAAGGVYHPMAYGATGDGSTDDRSALNYLANTAIPATGGTLLVDRAYKIASDLTIPANVTLQFTRAGKITVATTKTLTINGPIVAGRYKIFDLQGSGAVSINNAEVWVHWFGAVPDNAAVDNYDPFRQAIAAITGLSTRVLKLGNGTYTFLSKDGTNDCCVYIAKTMSIIGERRCILQADTSITPNSILKISCFGDSTYKFSPHVYSNFELDGNDLTRPFRVARGLHVIWDAVAMYDNIRIAGVGIGLEAGEAAYADSGIWNAILQNIYARGEDRATNYMTYGFMFRSQCNGLRIQNCYATYCDTCFYMNDANYCTIHTEVEDSALAYSLTSVHGSSADLACERTTRFADIQDCHGLTLNVVAYDVGDTGTPPANLMEFKTSSGTTYNEIIVQSFVWSPLAGISYLKQIEITQTYVYGCYLFSPVTGMHQAIDQDGDQDWVQWLGEGIGPLVDDDVTGTYTPDCLAGCRRVWRLQLTGNLTIAAAQRPQIGQRLLFLLKQDGTGGFTVTFDAVYRVTWSDTGNSANRWACIEVVYLGTGGEGGSTYLPVTAQTTWRD